MTPEILKLTVYKHEWLCAELQSSTSFNEIKHSDFITLQKTSATRFEIVFIVTLETEIPLQAFSLPVCSSIPHKYLHPLSHGSITRLLRISYCCQNCETAFQPSTFWMSFTSFWTKQNRLRCMFLHLTALKDQNFWEQHFISLVEQSQEELHTSQDKLASTILTVALT